MVNRLSLSALLLAFSVAPALAGDGQATDFVGPMIIALIRMAKNLF
jgi:hypothetical protein